MNAGSVTKNALRDFPITMYRAANTQHAAIPNNEAGNEDALPKERTSNPFDASRKMFGTMIAPYAAVRKATKNNSVAGINPNRKRGDPSVLFTSDGGVYGSVAIKESFWTNARGHRCRRGPRIERSGLHRRRLRRTTLLSASFASLVRNKP